MKIRRSDNVHPTRTRSAGQAILEFALTISVIMMLLTAAIDIGIAYKSRQMLINSVAEAISYLALNPLVSCSNHTCPDGTPLSGANREALIRFRNEQGKSAKVKGVTSSMDLDGNGVDDVAEHGWGWINQQVIIQEADSSQIQPGTKDFGVGNSFNGTSDTNCKARKRFDASSGQCYIVIRAVMTYRPFMLKPLLGDSVTIRTIAVKPIVAGE